MTCNVGFDTRGACALHVAGECRAERQITTQLKPAEHVQNSISIAAVCCIHTMQSVLRTMEKNGEGLLTPRQSEEASGSPQLNGVVK